MAGRIPFPPGVPVATDEDGRKPDPAPLRLVVEKLAPKGLAVVGDTLNDLRMTQAYSRVGTLPAICVIRCDVDESESYMRAGAIATIRALGELPAALRAIISRPDRILGSVPERIAVLHGITAAMLGILDLDRLLPEIVRSATALESADAASVMLVADDGATLRIVAQHGLSEEYAASQRIPLETAQAMYRGFDAHLDIDLRKQPLGDPALIEREGLARVVAMPLVHEGALIGGINVYTRDQARTFDAVDVEILHILAAQASVAIANARLYAEERSSRRLQESLLESLGDGVVIAFPNGTMRMNRAARELFGVEEHEALDRTEYRQTLRAPSEVGVAGRGRDADGSRSAVFRRPGCYVT